MSCLRCRPIVPPRAPAQLACRPVPVLPLSAVHSMSRPVIVNWAVEGTWRSDSLLYVQVGGHLSATHPHHTHTPSTNRHGSSTSSTWAYVHLATFHVSHGKHIVSRTTLGADSHLGGGDIGNATMPHHTHPCSLGRHGSMADWAALAERRTT